MTLEVTFALDDSDLERLRKLFSDTRTRRHLDDRELVESAKKLVRRALSGNLPSFVRNQLEGLDRLVTIIDDDAWNIPAEERERILDGIAYFVASDDLIPDSTPILGLLDDAIAAELVLRALKHELEAYEEFSRFRTAESQRRANVGKPTDVSKEDWLADKRATLHHRMRERRAADPQGWHTITLWGND